MRAGGRCFLARIDERCAKAIEGKGGVRRNDLGRSGQGCRLLTSGSRGSGRAGAGAPPGHAKAITLSGDDNRGWVSEGHIEGISPVSVDDDGRSQQGIKQWPNGWMR